jgi:D-amino peptidase
MKVFLSVDLEGICGISSMKQISSAAPEYGHARQLMTEDVNAAVAGAVEGGADEIVVRDAHGPAINIYPDKLHPAATLIAGWSPTLDMLQGLDSSFGTAFFIGYHPGPASSRAVLSHTYSMETIRGVELNGIPAGETLLNALQAGLSGVPVGLVTGERALHEEIKDPLAGVGFVETKIGYGFQSALLHPVEKTRALIKRAAADAVRRAASDKPLPPYRPQTPVRARVEFLKAEALLAVALVPGIEASGTQAALLQAATAEEFFRRFQLMCQVLYGLRS